MCESKQGLKPASLKKLKSYLPKINDLIKFKSLKNPIDSSSIKPKDWIEIAKEIKKVYDNYDGFIILHGTDTMAYSASIFSFMFENLSKPIILTGSQLPISNPRSDGKINFINSIFVAKEKKINEVVILFGNKILRGNRSIKVSSTSFNAFNSPNFSPLGLIGKDIKIDKKLLLKSSNKKFKINYKLETMVANIVLTPTTQMNFIRDTLLNKNIKAIIIESYGAGNMPEDIEFLNLLKKAIKRGKIIVNITQIYEGIVEMGLYKTSDKLKSLGVISGFNMTLEATISKLMWVIANYKSKEVKTIFAKSLRGEL